MEAVDPLDEGLEPLFNHIPIDVVNITVNISPYQRDQRAHPVDEKRNLREVMFLVPLAKKCSRYSNHQKYLLTPTIYTMSSNR